MKILAIGHRKNVGKDTAARFLANMYRVSNPGCNVNKSAFAIKLYDICYQLFGWAGFQSYEYYQQYPEHKNDLLPTIGKTIRHILIEVGMRMREIYPTIWIDYLFTYSKKCDLLIISDLRFPNEFEAIQNQGGFCIRIDRPSIEPTPDEADEPLANCSSEWDSVIINGGTPADLYDKVKQVCTDLLKVNLNG